MMHYSDEQHGDKVSPTEQPLTTIDNIMALAHYYDVAVSQVDHATRVDSPIAALKEDEAKAEQALRAAIRARSEA